MAQRQAGEGHGQVKVVDAGRMAEIDRRTQADFGVPSALLMEDAGVRLFRVLAREVWGGRPPALPVRVLAGKGNNGGDALVMARQLWLEGFRGVSVLLAAGEPAPGTPPAVQLQACRRLGMEVADLAAEPAALERALAGPCWLLDGLFGTGLKGALKPPLSALVERVNALVAAAGAAAPATGAAAAARRRGPRDRDRRAQRAGGRLPGGGPCLRAEADPDGGPAQALPVPAEGQAALRLHPRGARHLPARSWWRTRPSRARCCWASRGAGFPTPAGEPV